MYKEQFLAMVQKLKKIGEKNVFLIKNEELDYVKLIE